MKTRAALLGLLLACSSIFLSGPANGVRGSDQAPPDKTKGEVVLTVRSVLTVSGRAQGVFDEPAVKPEGEIRKEVNGQDRITYVFSGTQKFDILDYDGNIVLLDNSPRQVNHSLTIEGGGDWSSLMTADGKVAQRVKGSWTYAAPSLPRDADFFHVEDLVLDGNFSVWFGGPIVASPNVKSQGEAFDESISPEARPFTTSGWAVDHASHVWNGALSNPGFRNRFKGTAPANKTGFQMTRQAEFADSWSEDLGRQDHYLTGIFSTWTGRVTVTYTLSYSPVPLDTEAVIETPKGYGDWWPVAGKTENEAGRAPLTVMVRVHKRGAPKQPAPKKAKFRFELVDTTQEKGVCLNWPTEGTDSYDLRIEQKKNPELNVLNPQGQQAETKDKDLDQSYVTISCFDYGAFGRLKVTAILDDGKGTEVPAYLDSDNSKNELTIPKDDNDNRIADGWEYFHDVSGGAEDSDREYDPAGDGDSGDGLTLYEEYRGFMEDGTHICGDPLKKDFFLCNKIGPKITRGIELFEGITGLRVHSKLTEEELGKNRVINRNHTGMPHAVDQHGVLVKKGSERYASYAVGEPDFGDSIIGTPKRWNHVEIGLNLWGAKLDATVAHELMHTCMGRHHGEIDTGRKKIRSVEKADKSYDIRLYDLDDRGNVVGQGQSIRLFDEEGEAIVPLSGREKYLREGYKTYVGNKQGQHSGDVSCVMRYTCAHCYVNEAGGYVLFPDFELVGMGLCLQITGTGVNESGRRPEPRYGDADAAAKGGNCIKTLCVNDKSH